MYYFSFSRWNYFIRFGCYYVNLSEKIIPENVMIYNNDSFNTTTQTEKVIQSTLMSATKATVNKF